MKSISTKKLRKRSKEERRVEKLEIEKKMEKEILHF